MSRPRIVRKLGELDVVFGALAHPTRREILLVLHDRGGEGTAGDQAPTVEPSWPTPTPQLARLVESGMVTVRKSGRERLYRLDRDRLVGGLGLWLHRVEIGVIDHRRGSGR
jgi:DNA-binding transcriptional ArsR family regulator